MKVRKKVAIGKPVIRLKIIDDKKLVAIDSHTTIRFFEKNEMKLLTGFKVNISHKYYKNQVVDFSSNGVFFATISQDAKESRLYSVKTKKMIARIRSHQGEVSCLSFDPFSRYMFSGGEDGKTFAVDTQSGKILFTLPHHADTINDITFTKSGSWMATSSYDRKVQLFNLTTMKSKEKFRGHAKAVMKALFYGHAKVVSMDKDSEGLIWNIATYKILSRFGIHDEVLQMVLSKDEKFLFLGTKLGYIVVFDMESEEIISDRLIKVSSSITALCYDGEKDHLIVGSEDGYISQYYIYDGIMEMKRFLVEKKLAALEELVQKNPLLLYTDIYEKALAFWDASLKKARIAFENGDKEKALEILQPFREIPSKNAMIQRLVRDYEDFDKFALLVKSGKYPLAYSMAAQHPGYKESMLYKAMEKKWSDAVSKASKLALSPRGIEEAKEVLKPFRGISEKSKIIQEIVTQGEISKRFRELVSQKEFQMASELAKRHSFLQELPEYKKMMQYAESLYAKAHELINSGEGLQVLKILRLLSEFPDYKEKISGLLESIERKQHFIEAAKKHHLATAYKMLAEDDSLAETDIGKELMQVWETHMQKAKKFALQGDCSGVEETLHKFFKVETKFSAIATIFAWCYINQLEKAIREKLPCERIAKGIKNYIALFGFDDQIELIFKVFQKRCPENSLDIENLHEGSLQSWRPTKIYSSILDDLD